MADAEVLRPAVAMVDQGVTRTHRALVQRLLERVERQVGAQRVRHPPAHDAPRSSALSRSRSALVSPAHRPWSRSPCRTHLRNVSFVHPIFCAIDPIAAHCESWADRTT